MSRRKNNRRARQRLKKQRQNEEHEAKLITFVRKCFASAYKQVGWLIGALVTVVTLVCAWYAFQSKIEISYGALLDGSNPYSTPFTLTNNGLLPLYNINWRVDLIDVDYGIHSKIHDNSVSHVQEISPLDPGKKTTMFIAGPYSTNIPMVVVDGTKLQKMKLLFSVNYQNFFKLSEKQNFRFVCILTKDGHYEWLPYDSTVISK